MTKVIGTNLAALIFATEITDAGLSVTFNAPKGFAGHFRGLEIGRNREDIGMILLEPARTETIAPVDEYSGESRAEAAKYADHFIHWLGNRGLTLSPVEVLTLFRGELVDDYFIRDSLKVLNFLTSKEREQIGNEIQQNLENDQMDVFHPSLKNKEVEFKKHNYRTAVINSVGPTFYHLLFAPWLEKTYGEANLDLVAAEHRIAWMPLYYPETVVEALKGNSSLEEHEFLYPAESSFAQLISELEVQLRSSPFATEINEESEIITSPSDMSETTAYFGKPEGSKVAIPEHFTEVYFNNVFTPGKQVLFETKVESSKTIFIADGSSPAIRVNTRSRTTGSGGTISIEFGKLSEDLSDAELINESLKLLNDLEIPVEQKDQGIVSTFAYPLRTVSPNITKYLDSIGVSGSAIGFPIGEFNSSMNDQAIAALSTASKIIKGKK